MVAYQHQTTVIINDNQPSLGLGLSKHSVIYIMDIISSNLLKNPMGLVPLFPPF